MNRHRLLSAALILTSSLSGASLSAAEAAAPNSGEKTWALYCEGCHAAGTGEHPGTLRLSYTRGAELEAIKGRKDLTPEYLRQVVRMGFLEMVGFRKTEISDQELEALIDYIRE